MPGFDRTGPDGVGPMTGGMRGPCSGDSTPVTDSGRPGMSFRGRGGRGRGNRYWFRATGLPRYARMNQAAAEQDASGIGSNDEIGLLRRETDIIRRSLDSMGKRIEELLKKGPERKNK